MFYTKGWSLDACCGEALLSHKFSREEMVCTKTLYNYVTLGLIGALKSIDLPLRVKRKNKSIRRVSARRSLGAASRNEMHPLMIAKSSGIGSATSCWEGAAMMKYC